MLLDVAIGIIGALLAWPGVVLPPASFLALGMIFAVAPDIDVILSARRLRGRGRYAHRHRDVLHSPLLYLPIGFLLLAPVSERVAVLFVALSLFHFLHDSVGIGWGVRWLYPFSPDAFKFFADAQNHFSWHMCTRWTPDELSSAVERYGHDDWFARYYLHPHPIGIIENSIFVIVVLCVALLYLR